MAVLDVVVRCTRTQILYGAFANARIQKYLFKKFAECGVLAKQLLHSIEWNANAIFFWWCIRTRTREPNRPLNSCIEEASQPSFQYWSLFPSFLVHPRRLSVLRPYERGRQQTSLYPKTEALQQVAVEPR